MGDHDAVIPVFRTVNDSYRIVFRHPVTLAQLLWLPFLLACALTLPFWMTQAAVFGYLAFMAQLLMFAIGAVAVHRFVLLGERPEGALFHLHLGRREGWYTLVGFGFSAVTAIALLPVTTSGLSAPPSGGRVLALWVVISALAFLGVRLCLMFPAIAVEERADFRAAFRMTRGRFWRIFTALLLVILPLQLASALARWVIAGAALGSISPVLRILTLAALTVLTAIATSLVYRAATPNPYAGRPL